MLDYVDKKEFKKAMEVADTIDWTRVKSVPTLTTVSEIYEHNKEYKKAKNILEFAHDRSSGSKKIIYKLGIMYLRLGEVAEASDCYEEFIKIAPRDSNQYILKYRILRASNSPLTEQIDALKDFKNAEYIEKWAYELAKLYAEAGMISECIEECDDLMLWFSDGKYVMQAMELKKKYKPLTPLQQEKYNAAKKITAPKFERPTGIKERATELEEKEEANEEINKDLVSEDGEKLVPFNEEDELPDTTKADRESMDVMDEISDEDDEEDVTFAGEPSVHEVDSLVGLFEENEKTSEEETVEDTVSDDEEKEEVKATNPIMEAMGQDIWEMEEDNPLDEEEVEPTPENQDINNTLNFKPVDDEDLDKTVKAASFRIDDILSGWKEKQEKFQAEINEQAKKDEEELSKLKEESKIKEEESKKKAEEEAKKEFDAKKASEEEEQAKIEAEEALEEVRKIEKENEPVSNVLNEALKNTANIVPITIPLDDEEEDEVEEAGEEDNSDDSVESIVSSIVNKNQDEDERDTEEASDYQSELSDSEFEDYDDEDTYEDVDGFNIHLDDVEEVDLDDDETNSMSYDDEDLSDEFEEYIDEDEEDEPSEDTEDDGDEEKYEDIPEEEDDVDKTLRELGESHPELIEPSEAEIKRRMKKKGGGIPFDTGFVVTGRYDLSATSEIGLRAGLTEDQKKLFSYFVPVRGMSEQIVEVLDNDRRARKEGSSRTGNILVIGTKGSGKTVLAVDMVKAIQKQRNLNQGKVAIVTGESLNTKELVNIFKKLRGGAIIVEKAGKLNSRTIKELNRLMEKQTGELLFVLEDEKTPMEKMLKTHPDFRKKFTSKLDLPVFINDELVTFGQTYAKENGYKLDEMGILALYSRIDVMQREDHAVSVAEVKEIMDAAIEHSQRANVKHLARRVFGKSTDASDRIILKEDDFRV
ncbi:MAG: hypothetical protein LBM02_04985 [Lachnospiraceae bacterium]|nr:hypothetical protein [Lachnospiraceae bacterium]